MHASSEGQVVLRISLWLKLVRMLKKHALQASLRTSSRSSLTNYEKLYTLLVSIIKREEFFKGLIINLYTEQGSHQTGRRVVLYW
jgi:hypothetical protein